MKKIFLILLVSVTTGVFAQSTSNEDFDVIQGVYGKSKKELATSFMGIPGNQSAAFWKIYDEFEIERKVLGKNEATIIQDYANNYENLTNDKADKLALASLKNNEAYQKLFSKYYGKYKKGIGAVNAAKIIQFENYMRTRIQSEIQNSIPFIGELEKSK